MSSSCLFCKVVAREIPAKIILENDQALSFHDIKPVAPAHALVIPKKHLASIHDASPEDAGMLGAMLLLARETAETLGLGPDGYRLVVNTGTNGGQTVHHLHVHVLGGRGLGWPPG